MEINKIKDKIVENKCKIIIASVVRKIFVVLALMQYKTCTEIEVLPPKQNDHLYHNKIECETTSDHL